MKAGHNLLSGAVLPAVIVAAGLLAGCTPPMVREVRQTCASAPDRAACEDAEYARRYAIERARLRKTYW